MSAERDKLWLARRIVKNKSGCWLWIRAITSRGYGALSRNNRNISAHRFAYQVYRGPIPEGKLVCHHCDVKHCVNPRHLFVGTLSDNLLDMYAKGRGGKRGRSGEDNAMAILRNEEVLVIKQRLSTGETCTQIARDFGVSMGTIWDIKAGRKWKSLLARIEKEKPCR